MENAEFTYLYRDAGNYKKSGRVIFSNREGLDIDSASKELRQLFLPDGLFIARQIRLPEVFLYERGKFTEDDHCFHEFNALNPSSDTANDLNRRSIRDFLMEVAREASRGWQTLSPDNNESGLFGFL